MKIKVSSAIRLNSSFLHVFFLMTLQVTRELSEPSCPMTILLSKKNPKVNMVFLVHKRRGLPIQMDGQHSLYGQLDQDKNLGKNLQLFLASRNSVQLVVLTLLWVWCFCLWWRSASSRFQIVDLPLFNIQRRNLISKTKKMGRSE